MRRRAQSLIAASLALGAAALPLGANATPNAPSPDGAGRVPRTFGVYVDPWHIDDWARNVGSAPQLVAKFESFSQQRTLDDFLREAERQGLNRTMISWEPWKPVPPGGAQSLPQPGYRNRDILHGVQDRYILRFARSLSSFRGVVYLRYAHEMNGTWYPWSREPNQYTRAWTRIVRLFRSVGARNVRFVWSVNPNLYEAPGPWLRNLRRYWPGAGFVDYVGSTMINFGGARRARYTVGHFAQRFRTLRHVYRKPVLLTETNTDYDGRVEWLSDLRRMLRGMPWIRSVVWSQLPSRGQAQMKDAGELNWDVQRDPPAAGVLRGIIRDGRG